MKTEKRFQSNLVELGHRIYYFRVFSNLTLKEMAAMLQLSTVAYRNIETGKTNPSYTKLLSLAEIFKIDICDLINPQNNIQFKKI